ncbi:hypothetical protein BGW36DRAFT_399578 [Talaromyces proteolyticus]|uniref:Integral membrane protein n=1 Tax=Talaromyces proteolyticus TaxID=1131652 RepID=A0AAD4PWT3_9EURO|nr:uncharacterized protein BGW36DRAFT_399578 [Talaromyces proteolyticus]KAH8692777.1 hypothetical protein BGW36DRAFT_399578 [Talaromyces proteolyticus]
MTENRHLIPVLVTMMLVTGVCNTILNKYQDMQCVRNCDSPDVRDHSLFEQPVIQTAQMFIGEMGCWLVVFISHLYTRFSKRQRAAPLLAGGYRPVRSDEPDHDVDEEGEEEEDQTLVDSEEDPAAKPLIGSDTGRIHLRGWRVLLLAAPACCDITGTTLMNVGLLFVAASIYQMTRGALVLFVGLFSVLLLHRKLYLYQWLGLVVVVLGVALVGLAGVLFGNSQGHDLEDGINNISLKYVRDIHTSSQTPESVAVLIGVFLIAAAQIFTASQFVLEEWILENYAMAPLKVVGWEGIFGFLVTVIAMIILHLTVGKTDAGRYGYFDLAEGWHEITSNRQIIISSVLIMISIGGFNFFGLSVTRTVSATSRSTIDTCRTLFIWLVSLALGWENFKWLQVVGFVLLVYGTFLFNDIVRPPLKALLPKREVLVHEELLPEEPIEHI